GILKGGEKGPAVDLEKPEDSVLLAAVNHEGPKMPPKTKLPQQEIDILTRWVKTGLPWLPGGGDVVKTRGGQVTEEARNYWAYKPVKRAAIPEVKDGKWVRTPIDAFILAKLEANHLTPAAPADKVALVRRAYYDLIGLPPMPEEVDAFVTDPSPDAWEKLI